MSKLGINFGKILFGALLSISMLGIAFTPQVALAVIVTNTVTGDVAGTGGDLTNATFDLDVSTLGLVKTAFLTDGTQLSSGDAVAKGTLVQFVIYVDNNTAADTDSVNVADDLGVDFTFLGPIRADSTIASGSTEAQIYTALTTATVQSNAVDLADMAGISGTTVSAGYSAGNDMVEVPRQRVWAMMFTARVN